MTLGQSGPGSNEGVLRIPQGPSITGTSSSQFSVISRTLIGVGAYPSAQVHSVYTEQIYSSLIKLL